MKLMLGQHIGAPSVPVVSKGEQVSKGEVAARPAEGLSVAIHASISGIVTEVTEQYIMIQS